MIHLCSLHWDCSQVGLSLILVVMLTLNAVSGFMTVPGDAIVSSSKLTCTVIAFIDKIVDS